MKIDLRRAAAFHAVARAGGINAAARNEGRSPPSIHADFRRFERDAGVPLAERVGRRLRLTPEGRALYEAIDRALAEVAHAAEQVRSEAPAAVPLRIGCVTGFGRYRLAPRVFREAERTRRIVLRMGSHDQILDWLSAGVIDLGITYRGVVAAPIESVAVAEETLWLVGRRTARRRATTSPGPRASPMTNMNMCSGTGSARCWRRSRPAWRSAITATSWKRR